MQKILILGGCGYVGSSLVNLLLKYNYKVSVIDNQWFGKNISNHKNLNIIKKDIRDLNIKDFKNYKTVIHLANIANDPSVDLNPTLSWEVNALALKNILEYSIQSGVEKFIYASSGSVYGFSKRKKVTEDHELIPISYYNKTKMIAERILLSYRNEIKTFIVRPGTICGVSNRTRLDLVVNMFCYFSEKNKIININGGSQIRPNIHLEDMINAYKFLLEKNIDPGIYNLGNENLSITKIAKLVQKYTKCDITFSESNDNRSYRLDSSKIISKGFQFKKNVEDAIQEVIEALNSKKIIVRENLFTVSWMKKNNFT